MIQLIATPQQPKTFDEIDRVNTEIINSLRDLPTLSLKSHILLAIAHMDRLEVDLLKYYYIPNRNKPYIVQRKNAVKKRLTWQENQ